MLDSLRFQPQQVPAIWALLLIASAWQPRLLVATKPGSGRSVIVPLLSRKGCEPVVAFPHEPTTWPESLIPAATLSNGTPRPVHFLPLHTEASWPVSALVSDQPATSPERLIASPALKLPLPRVPRSVMVPLFHTNAWYGCSVQTGLWLPYRTQFGVGTSVVR